ncbi:MAG TPA: response regulator transcription factor [Burkholderiales bacterium]|nr:response regulator transcription factor [Burkholderiales bacterium]
MNAAAPAGRTALVIDDDPSISTLLQIILKREGYTVTCIRDGREAQKAIEDGAVPALVTLDLMLPHVDGYALLELMRAREAWRNVPVLMLTARSQEKDMARAMERGASEFIVKPFKPEELRERVRRLVGASS